MCSYTWGVGTFTFLPASLFEHKKGSNPRKTCFFISFPPSFFANAQLTQILTATSILPAIWTYTWSFGTTINYSAPCLITKRTQNQVKLAFLFVFRSYFLLTLSLLKFWQPRQLYQPCGLKHEVLRYKILIWFEFVVIQIP